MGVFGRDRAFDLLIFNEIAEGDEDDPAATAARDILGQPRHRTSATTPSAPETEAQRRLREREARRLVFNGIRGR